MKKTCLLLLSLCVAATSFADGVKIQMPSSSTVPAQNRCGENSGWSCGVNSAARVLELAFQRNNTRPVLNFQNLLEQCPRCFDSRSLKSMGASCESIGPTPNLLAAFMNEQTTWTRFGTMVGEQAFEKALDEVSNQRPVIVLLKTGEFRVRDRINLDQAGLMKPMIERMLIGVLDLTVPLMHYVTLIGFDDVEKTVTYLDTDGLEKTRGIAEFREKMNWRVDASDQLKENLREKLTTLKNGMLGMLLGPSLNHLEHVLDVSGNSIIFAESGFPDAPGSTGSSSTSTATDPVLQRLTELDLGVD